MMLRIALFLFATQCLGVLGTEAELLSLPVDCQDGDVYPLLGSCNQYVECRGNRGAVKDCPTSATNQGNLTLDFVCPAINATNNDSCGYTACVDATTSIAAYTSPRGNTPTPYYGMCVRGTVVYQGKCREVNEFTQVFDPQTRRCTLSCTTDAKVPLPQCRGYMECVNNAVFTRLCRPGFLYNGVRCFYNYSCPT